MRPIGRRRRTGDEPGLAPTPRGKPVRRPARHLDQGLQAAATLNQARVDGAGPMRLGVALIQHPRLVVRAIRYIASCTTMTLPLSDGAGGRRIQGCYRARSGRGKWYPGQAVLDIAETEEEYLRGSHRQALRTNVRRAQTDGLTCRLGTPVEEAYRGVPTGDRHVMVVAGDESGPIAWANATIDGRWALLENQYSLTPGVQHPTARYLLHLFLLRQLRQRGVRYLWVAGVFRVGSGMHYYQHLLGFETVNLRLVRGTDVPTSRCKSE